MYEPKFTTWTLESLQALERGYKRATIFHGEWAFSIVARLFETKWSNADTQKIETDSVDDAANWMIYRALEVRRPEEDNYEFTINAASYNYEELIKAYEEKLAENLAEIDVIRKDKMREINVTEGRRRDAVVEAEIAQLRELAKKYPGVV
jgi:hypothetical protein